jgi:hypothetical protein
VIALLGVATLASFWRREPDVRAPAGL